MNEKLTEVVFILDKSGSMSGLESDTIGGFNAMLGKQKEENEGVTISTVLFDDAFHVIHDRLNIKDVKPLTNKDYFVGGTTALLDAVGRSIRKIRNVYAETLREDRPSKVLFMITTDGMENASTEYSYSKVKQMISEVKEKYNWEFIFFGANIDAVSEAKKFGITPDRAVQYHADEVGTTTNFKAMRNVMASYANTGNIDKNWKKDVEEDFDTRK